MIQSHFKMIAIARLGVGGKEVEVSGEATEEDWLRLTAMARKEVHAKKEERLMEKAAKKTKNVEPVAVEVQSPDNLTSSDTIKATSSPINFKPFRVPTRVGTTLPQFTAARVVAPGQPMFDCHSPGAIVMPNPPPGHPLRREASMVQVCAKLMFCMYLDTNLFLCRWWLTLTLANSCDHIKERGFFFCTVVSWASLR